MCISFGNPSEPCCDGGGTGKIRVPVDIWRIAEFVRPLNDDATFPDVLPWVAIEPRNVVQTQTARYAVHVSDFSNPVYVGPDPNVFNPLGDRWEFLTAPLRHRVSNASLYLRTLASETAQDKRPTAHGAGIPAGSHCGSLTLNTLELPVFAAIAGSSPHGWFYGGSTTAYVRIFVNGVNVSGVVPVVAGFTNQINADAIVNGIRVALSSPIVVRDGATIEWDIWFKIQIRGEYYVGVSAPDGFLEPLVATESSAFQFSYYGDRINYLFGALSGGNANYRKLTNRLGWRLKLFSGGEYLFGGESRELKLIAQDGWVYSDSSIPGTTSRLPPDNIHLFVDNGVGTGDSIRFRWQQELPEIILTTWSGGTGIRVRYQIFGTAYDPSENARNGVWNPLRRTTFTLQGAEVVDGVEGLPRSDRFYWSSIALSGENFAIAPARIQVIPYRKPLALN